MVTSASSINGLLGARIAPTLAADTPEVKKIKETAQAFEGILLRQMLRELRNASIDSVTRSSNTDYLEMADDNLANHIAQAGGLGFGKAMAEQMLKQIQGSQLINSAQKTVLPAASSNLP